MIEVAKRRTSQLDASASAYNLMCEIAVYYGCGFVPQQINNWAEAATENRPLLS